MAAKLQECLLESDGAHFYRGDLHIHSYSASHDVSDKAMTPQAIVDTAVQEDLRIIAIADHNEIGNVQAAVTAGEAAGTAGRSREQSPASTMRLQFAVALPLRNATCFYLDEYRCFVPAQVVRLRESPGRRMRAEDRCDRLRGASR
jgi:hypothetical protein